jgi:hypothetical protein
LLVKRTEVLAESDISRLSINSITISSKTSFAFRGPLSLQDCVRQCAVNNSVTIFISIDSNNNTALWSVRIINIAVVFDKRVIFS